MPYCIAQVTKSVLFQPQTVPKIYKDAPVFLLFSVVTKHLQESNATMGDRSIRGVLRNVKRQV